MFGSMQPSLFASQITPKILPKAPQGPPKVAPRAPLLAPPATAGPVTDSTAKLNPAQREAVCAPDGPVLVIAGAGSGKTRTLVHRLAYLVERGVAPEGLLLLTFTRKSAQEMIARAGLLLGDASCRRVCGGTFHATANLLLRRYAAHVGYQANFTILDQGDAEGIINLLKSSLGLGRIGRRFPSRRLISGVLSRAVNTGKTTGDLMEAEYGHLLEFLDDILVIGEHYHKFKLTHGLMDYDDLLVYLRRLLRSHPVVRDELARRFQAILVDEYQDTNPIQAEIVRLLAAPRNNVMAVGDDAQSIYSFRGADFRNIMEFPDHFPGTRVIRLEENYRSTPEILNLSNAIIAPAPEQFHKKLFSRLAGGDRPTLHKARNEGGQARFVVEKIRQLQAQGIADDQIAVLFRSGFHSYKLELELAAHGIAFEKRGGLKLTESAHIKDVLAHFRVLCNPADRLSWNRILLLLDKLGPKTADKIVDGFSIKGESAACELTSGDDEGPKGIAPHLQVLATYAAGKPWQVGLQKLMKLLDDIQGFESAPLTMLELALAYYQPIFQRLYPDDYPRRQRDLDQLCPLLSAYGDIRDFLVDTALDPPAPDPQAGEEKQGRLVLSTVHSAKGLEWDSVFIIHLAEGKFPSSQAEGVEQHEEERRLLYVAATRAKRNLYLSFPGEVAGFDRRPSLCEPSSLLGAIPLRLFCAAEIADRPEPGFADRAKPSRVRRGGFVEGFGRDQPGQPGRWLKPGSSATGTNAVSATKTEPDRSWSVGARVRHSFFGLGILLKQIDSRAVEVNFDRHGRKILYLDYAKLEKL
ncbi:MAG: ATP-dependent helicase [Desulfobulbaceae bacterium]|nr:MAG: ATP-dependent helicase [Desulfobulbaceae bacterium]